MLVNTMKKDDKIEKTYDKVFELQDITRLIESAHNNIKKCREELQTDYSKAKEDVFVKTAQEIYSKLYKKNVHVYDKEKKINKRQSLIVWANDLLASRGYRMFEIITNNFKNCKRAEGV